MRHSQKPVAFFYQMAGLEKLGFPEGLLAEKSVRLDVLNCQMGKFIAINKPANFYLEADGIAENPRTIIASIKAQVGKKELERLGVETPYAVFVTDPEISGVALIASNKNSSDELRNAFGSGLFEFEFEFLSERPYGKVEEVVDLPLIRHENKPRTIVSHRFGKKCQTKFELKEDFGEWQLWSAKTNFLRWHQIRIHAAEAGLRMVGDDTYVRVRKIFLSRLKRGQFKGEEVAPVYDNLALHLSKLTINLGGEKFEISAPMPKGFSVLLKKIRNRF